MQRGTTIVGRLAVLDGWRGISILSVLAGHLVPIGPKALNLNVAVAGVGMAIFFTLSGFLITNVLLKAESMKSFLIHRVMRIIPLAWLAIALTLASTHADLRSYAPLMLFYANETGFIFLPGTGHFWSLALEMQFYLFVALLVSGFGRRALFALPLLSLAVTCLRVWMHVTMIINTEYRVDEILAGCTLALLWHSRVDLFSRRWLGFAPFLAAPLLLASASPAFGVLNYIRPYLAAILVGSTLGHAADHPMRKFLGMRSLKYLAEISFALYVVHGCLVASWLASGDKAVKYMKRPLFLIVTFVLAHLSTRLYEPYFINMGRRWTEGRPSQQVAADAEPSAL